MSFRTNTWSHRPTYKEIGVHSHIFSPRIFLKGKGGNSVRRICDVIIEKQCIQEVKAIVCRKLQIAKKGE